MNLDDKKLEVLSIGGSRISALLASFACFVLGQTLGRDRASS